MHFRNTPTRWTFPSRPSFLHSPSQSTRTTDQRPILPPLFWPRGLMTSHGSEASFSLSRKSQFARSHHHRIWWTLGRGSLSCPTENPLRLPSFSWEIPQLDVVSYLEVIPYQSVLLTISDEHKKIILRKLLWLRLRCPLPLRHRIARIEESQIEKW